MAHLQRLVGVFVIIISLWFALLGNISSTGLITGLLIALSVNLLFLEVISTHISPRILTHILLGLIYLPLFMLEIFKSSFRMSWLTLQPKPQLKPGIISLPLDLDTPAAMTMLAIMVTLTPGTLSLDLDQKNKRLYVHWANMTTLDPDQFKEQSMGGMESWARRMFQR